MQAQDPGDGVTENTVDARWYARAPCVMEWRTVILHEHSVRCGRRGRKKQAETELCEWRDSVERARERGENGLGGREPQRRDRAAPAARGGGVWVRFRRVLGHGLGFGEKWVWVQQELFDLHVAHLPGEECELVVGNVELVEVREEADLGRYKREPVFPFIRIRREER